MRLVAVCDMGSAYFARTFDGDRSVRKEGAQRIPSALKHPHKALPAEDIGSTLSNNILHQRLINRYSCGEEHLHSISAKNVSVRQREKNKSLKTRA